MIVSSPVFVTDPSPSASVSSVRHQRRSSPMTRSSESFMDRSAGKSTNFGGKNTNFGGIDHQVWCRVFRRHHPVKTADGVAADIGAPSRTVENWMKGVSAPSLAWFIRIVDAYGPQVLAEIMPDSCGWLSSAVRAERRVQLEAEQRRIENEMAALDEVHP